MGYWAVVSYFTRTEAVRSINQLPAVKTYVGRGGEEGKERELGERKRGETLEGGREDEGRSREGGEMVEEGKGKRYLQSRWVSWTNIFFGQRKMSPWIPLLPGLALALTVFRLFCCKHYAFGTALSFQILISLTKEVGHGMLAC